MLGEQSSSSYRAEYTKTDFDSGFEILMVTASSNEITAASPWTPKVCKTRVQNFSNATQRTIMLHTVRVQVVTPIHIQLPLRCLPITSQRNQTTNGDPGISLYVPLCVLYYTIPYYTIPYHTIPYYTIPYYTILYHTIPYHTIPYHTILYYTILYYTILYYTILYYTILYYTILYYTILYYTILYYTILYYTILYYTILLANALHTAFGSRLDFKKPSECRT